MYKDDEELLKQQRNLPLSVLKTEFEWLNFSAGIGTKKLSKCIKGGENRNKQRMKVAYKRYRTMS